MDAVSLSLDAGLFLYWSQACMGIWDLDDLDVCFNE